MRDPVKIHRILDVQQQLHRIEEWRLADLDRTLARPCRDPSRS